MFLTNAAFRRLNLQFSFLMLGICTSFSDVYSSLLWFCLIKNALCVKLHIVIMCRNHILSCRQILSFFLCHLTDSVRFKIVLKVVCVQVRQAVWLLDQMHEAECVFINVCVCVCGRGRGCFIFKERVKRLGVKTGSDKLRLIKTSIILGMPYPSASVV